MNRLRPALRPLRLQAQRSASTSASALKKTPLYDLHVARGAKMVPFAGYSMPVQYASLSVGDSHIFTRTHASIFDVSHMVQHTFSGPGAAAFLERVSPAEVCHSLGEMQSRLSALLWPETGGIADDLMITKTGADRYHVVTNAACREKDCEYIAKELSSMGADGRGIWKVEENVGLVALQGPESQAILSEIIEGGVDLSKLFFGHSIYAQLRLKDGTRTRELLISRGGYTGEDGFEISLILPEGQDTSVKELTAITETLLEVGGEKRVQLAGLGARDSLRLEAGMCLYGNDIDDATTPAEAGLAWIVSPERRKEGGFNGADVILPQLVPRGKGGKGVERRRAGFIVNGAPAREGAEIHTKDGEKIGAITSGCPSPTLGKNIAMGYVKDGFHKAGTELDVVVRGRKRSATVTKMPFVPTKYYKGE